MMALHYLRLLQQTAISDGMLRGNLAPIIAYAAVLIVCAATTLTVTNVTVLRHHDYQVCNDLLHFGRWLIPYDGTNQAQWQPYGRMLYDFDSSATSKCLGNQTLYFIGDSTIRQVFWATAIKLDEDTARHANAEAAKHENLVFQTNDVSLTFIWDPYLNTTEATDILDVPPGDDQTAGVLISTGLWHARHGGESFIQEYTNTLERVSTSARLQNNESARSNKTDRALLHPTIIVPPPHLRYDWLNPERAASLSKERLQHITTQLATTQMTTGMEVAWAARRMTYDNHAAIDSGGLHVTRSMAVHQANLLLNRICNKQLAGTNKASSYACVPTPELRWTWSVTFTVVLVLCWAGQHVLTRSAPRLCTLWPLLLLAVTLLYCWTADRTTLLSKADKPVNVRLFTYATIVSAFLGTLRLRRTPAKDSLPKTKDDPFHAEPSFLSRSQTEEWKGWMQIVILLYHYFHMSGVLWVYQIVRVMVAAYLFLTGYGHAAYFQRTGDFSIKRVVFVLLRLNMLPCLLAVVMNNTYDLYYFPALASLWFLITYATCWQQSGQRPTRKDCTRRVAVSMILVPAVLVYCSNAITMGLEGLRRIRGPEINPHEFVFRVELDVVAPFAGILFAICQNQQSTHFGSGMFARLRRLQPALSLIASGLLITTYWLVARSFKDKFAYNKQHSLLSLLPIAAYIMLRNCCDTARQYYSPLLASIGTYSLELFVLQYHIWLAADTKGLLRLGIIDTSVATPSGQTVAASWRFWAEGVTVTIVFFWTSRACAKAINAVVKRVLDVPDKVLIMRCAFSLIVLYAYNVLRSIDGRQ